MDARTDATLLDALRAVIDPELGESLVDAGLIERAVIEDRTARISVVALFPLETWEAQIVSSVHAAVAPLSSVDRVDVEFVDLTPEVESALATKLRPVDEKGQRDNPFKNARTRVLAIASGKGGVGKSSVTVNLAVALARAGRKVAIVDADVWGFSVPRMLGVTRPPFAIDRVIVPPVAHGVKVISMGFFASESEGVVWRGPMLHKALEQFLTDIHWGQLDYLVVDMPPGTGDVALSISGFLPRAEVVVVTTPQIAAQSVAQRAAAMAAKVHLSVIGVVENMSWFRGDDGKSYEIFGSGGGQSLADQLGVPLLGQVPLVPALREGGDHGRPITIDAPDSESSQVLFEIARRIDEELAPKKRFRPELRIG